MVARETPRGGSIVLDVVTLVMMAATFAISAALAVFVWVRGEPGPEYFGMAAAHAVLLVVMVLAFRHRRAAPDRSAFAEMVTDVLWWGGLPAAVAIAAWVAL